MPRPRHLVLVLGDQLDRRSAAFDGFDDAEDAVWMAEVDEEATHVPGHKTRLVLFFSALRHFRDELRERGVTVHYHELGPRASDDRGPDFAGVLREDVARLAPRKLIVLEPGDWRVRRALEAQAEDSGVELEIRADRHFYCSVDGFSEWAAGRQVLTLEHFYRHLRKKHDVLMTEDGPVGGRWNFDDENRESFGKDGPGDIKAPRGFRPDATTTAVVELVERRFADHPGSAEHFDLPVTRAQALAALRDFVEHRLPTFGRYEDAMWTGRPFLYHSRLSAALNLHLLEPRRCVEKAVEAHAAGRAPIASVEGFVRQILGWREFVRGIYWLHMPDYARLNALECGDVDVPSFFWDGDTEMRCIRDALDSVKRHAYAHHIQRLMVLGLFALQSGVHPRKFHDWHMAMYADAIDWVSLPNTLGMSQWGDGGIVGTKPYCATGAYVQRMSDYCRGCRYDPKEAAGDAACPHTTLYWDFLDRHAKRFAGNRRMGFQMKNLERKRKDAKLMKRIRERARWIRGGGKI